MKYNSIVLATHVWADGASQAFKKYLLRKTNIDLLWIAHPLFYDKRLNGSGYERYRDGQLIKKNYGRIKNLPLAIGYVMAFFLDIYFVLKQKQKYELYIGFNNLNAVAGLLLRKIGRVKTCVYHVTDFIPRRFENKILNWFYHKIENICAIRCNETWNLSFRMVEAREKIKGIKQERCGLQKQIPMGAWVQETKKASWEDVKKGQVVFMGHLLKKQGVQHVLEAVPAIIKKIPSFKFLIIGAGDYKEELKKVAGDLKIHDHVEFAGFVESHDKLEEMIAESAIAVAIYERGDLQRNWTYYTDQGKIKAYLGAGVPVLLTDVPPMAREIQKSGCGKIIEPTPQSIADAVIDLLQNPGKLKQYRNNASEYIKKFDWNLLLDKEFMNLKGRNINE